MEFFQYEPIIHDEHGFRIVRLLPGAELDIEVEIIHASFDESDLMEYEAVSYVWGSPELSSSIIVGGKKLNVTQNLELVLRDLRLPDEDRYLWIDGICIDQKKDSERNHQVRQMGTIYQRAELVLFYLGQLTDLTLALSESFSIYEEQHKLRPEMTFESVWYLVEEILAFKNISFQGGIDHALKTILDARWFRRIWIIQEVANSRRALIHLGSTSFPAALFVKLVRHLGVQETPHQKAILDMMPQKRRSKSPWSSQLDLYHLLERFRGAKASLEHDKIFALIGMCDGGKGHGTITADYSKSLDLIIREAIAYMGFCNVDDIDVGFYPMYRLLTDFDSLLGHLFIHLARKNKLTSLESLLRNRGKELCITDHMLRQAITLGNYAVIRLLLLYAERSLPSGFDWANAFVSPGSNVSLLWDAILGRETGSIKPLFVSGVDSTGLSPLELATMKGEEKIVKILLDSHLDGEVGTRTALYLAAKHGKPEIVRLLLDHGANVNSRDYRGRTPLSAAASAGFEAILLNDQSEAGPSAIEIIMGRSDQHESYAQSIREQFRSLQKDKQWPSQQLDFGTTRSLPALIRKDLGSSRGDGSHSHPDIFHSHVSPVYSEIVDLLLQRGADVESQDMLGHTPLWWAVNWGHLSVVEKLIQYNANIEIRGEFGMTPLSWAIWNGHQDVVQRLLDNHAEVNIIKFEHLHPLRESAHLFWTICSESDSQLLHLLINILETKLGAASYAISEEHIAIVQLLLNRNTTFANQHFYYFILAGLRNEHDDEIVYEDRTLLLATGKGDYPLVQRLLDGKVDPNAVDDRDQSALMIAASRGFGDIVELLIDKGANVDARKNGRTALQRVAYDGNHMMVRLLLKYGADIEADHNLGTPLILASSQRHQATVRVLLQNNANVHAKNQYGETALLVAANYNYGWDVDKKVGVARLLIWHGANIDARSNIGVTPIMWASRYGHKELVELLLLENANVDAKDSEGHSALYWSRARQHLEIEQMLKRKIGLSE